MIQTIPWVEQFLRGENFADMQFFAYLQISIDNHKLNQKNIF